MNSVKTTKTKLRTKARRMLLPYGTYRRIGRLLRPNLYLSNKTYQSNSKGKTILSTCIIFLFAGILLSNGLYLVLAGDVATVLTGLIQLIIGSIVSLAVGIVLWTAKNGQAPRFMKRLTISQTNYSRIAIPQITIVKRDKDDINNPPQPN